MTRPLHFSNTRVVLDDQSGHLAAPQFWEGPLISGKVSVPLKNDPFEEVKIIFGPPKKISTQGMDVPCAFCKKIDKNLSNVASAVARTFHCRSRFPSCTQSQHPINREMGYSNVLPSYPLSPSPINHTPAPPEYLTIPPFSFPIFGNIKLNHHPYPHHSEFVAAVSAR